MTNPCISSYMPPPPLWLLTMSGSSTMNLQYCKGYTTVWFNTAWQEFVFYTAPIVTLPSCSPNMLQIQNHIIQSRNITASWQAKFEKVERLNPIELLQLLPSRSRISKRKTHWISGVQTQLGGRERQRDKDSLTYSHNMHVIYRQADRKTDSLRKKALQTDKTATHRQIV